MRIQVSQIFKAFKKSLLTVFWAGNVYVSLCIQRILKIMTSNLILFPEKTRVTGMFYTLITVPHATLWNQATLDITSFDIMHSNVVRYANAMYENHKALI